MQNPEEHSVVYLMRGLPGCGKSHRVKRLAGEQGVVMETDEYFQTSVTAGTGAYRQRWFRRWQQPMAWTSAEFATMGLVPVER